MEMIHCFGCGKELHRTATNCPGCGALQAALDQVKSGLRDRSAFDWYLEPLRKYATFNGRARRKEYWYFTLFTIVACFVLGFIGGLIGLNDTLANLYNLAVLVPSIAVGIRRLHDTGRTGWWLLLPIVNIIFLAQDGEKGTNKYGDDPKAG